jgi:hypothetical protein
LFLGFSVLIVPWAQNGSGFTVVAVFPDAIKIKELMYFINAKLLGGFYHYKARTRASARRG